MLPYVSGALPIMVHANEIRQIKSAADWAATNGFKIILAGGRDAWRLTDLLVARRIPVIYDHTFTRPDRDTDPYDVHFHAPAILHQAGVTFAFGLGTDSFDAPMARNLPYAASQAVAFGLPEAEALKALTLYPAQLVGLGDRLGSIEPGKEATLFTAEGNILDLRVKVRRMWLAGKEISLDNRHSRLYDKYRNRPH
jgi:imidazolonepropionase-like amidohydrolase